MKRLRRMVVAVATVLVVVAGAPVHAQDADEPAPPSSTTLAATTTTVVPTTAPTTVSVPSTTVTVVVAEDPTSTSTATAPSVAEVEMSSPDGDAVPVSTVAVSEVASTSDTAAATVTGTAVATATSGGNEIVVDGGESSPSPAGPAAVDVSTGPAEASGSRDRTQIAQDADVVLTDQATAEIRQTVLVFNIGAALANSGMNGVRGGAGSAFVATGDAVAVGNDSSSSITQAAAADATSGGTNSTEQVAIDLRLGVAVADTGSNEVTVDLADPDGGAGGTVSAGAVSATGNESITDVVQRAVVTASGDSRATIEQRATVINLGVALANSGLNDVRDVAGSLLASPDELVAGQLFALLLPPLLDSAQRPGSSGGSGVVTTGNATAVGNRSTTAIEQSATVTAGADGAASVVQDVVVANIGAAVANTGANTVGGAPSRLLDAETAQVVADLSSFLAELLVELHRWDAATDGPQARRALRLSLGDLVIDLDVTFGGSAGAIAGDARSHLTQVAAVVNFGVSWANTGDNTTVVELGPAGDPSMAVGRANVGGSVVLTTGDARAVNRSTVVICQVGVGAVDPCDPTTTPPGSPSPPSPSPPSADGADDPGPDPGDVAELAPAAPVAQETGTPEPSPTVSPVRGADGALPQGGEPPPGRTYLPATGFDVDGLLVVASALVVLGLLLVRIRRSAVT